MVTLNVGGKAVSWADAEKVFAEVARTQRVEFQDESGQVIATTTPAPAWEQEITPEAIERAKAGPFFTFEEMKKRLGWE